MNPMDEQSTGPDVPQKNEKEKEKDRTRSLRYRKIENGKIMGSKKRVGILSKGQRIETELEIGVVVLRDKEEK